MRSVWRVSRIWIRICPRWDLEPIYYAALPHCPMPMENMWPTSTDKMATTRHKRRHIFQLRLHKNYAPSAKCSHYIRDLWWCTGRTRMHPSTSTHFAHFHLQFTCDAALHTVSRLLFLVINLRVVSHSIFNCALCASARAKSLIFDAVAHRAIHYYPQTTDCVEVYGNTQFISSSNLASISRSPHRSHSAR